MSNSFPAFISVEYDRSGSGFPAFERDLADVGNRARQRFEADFNEIQRIVQNALTVPRNAAGSLDLGAGAMQTAATNAHAYAVAMREVSTAAERAQRESNDNSEATRSYVQAARAAAAAAEENARALSAQAMTYERLQAEVNRTASATQQMVQAQMRGTTATQMVVNSAGAQRFAMIQVGQQLQDITVGFASGQRAAVIFAQQLPQLAFAMSDMGGKVGAAARVLSGPWGLAVFGAVTGIGFLIEAMGNGRDATEDQINALDIQANSYRTLQKVIDDFNRSQQQTTALTLAATEVQRDRTRELLATARAQLALVEAQNFSNFGEEAALAETGRQAEVSALRSEITRLTRDLNSSIRAAGDIRARMALDPEFAARTRAEDARAALATEQARTNMDQREYERRRTNIDRLMNAELAAIRRRQQAERDAARDRDNQRLPPVTLSEVRAVLERELGARITSTFRTPAQNHDARGARNSYHLTGQAVDFVPRGGMQGASRAQIRQTLLNAGIDVRELLGPGDPRHDNHFHVAFGRRRLRPDQAQAQTDREARRIEQAERAAEQLQRQIDNIGESAARMRGEFDEAPRDIDRANAAIINLNQLIADAQQRLEAGGLGEEQVRALNAAVASAIQTRDEDIPKFLRRPYEQLIEDGERDIEIQRLRAMGMHDAAQALDDQYRLMQMLHVESADQIQGELHRRGINEDILAVMGEQRVRMAEISREAARADRSGASISARLREVEGIRSNIEQSLARLPDDARGALTGFVSGLRSQFNDLFARQLTESLFGNTFANLEAEISNSPRARADRAVAEAATKAHDALIKLTDSVNKMAATINGTIDPAAANDNGAAKDIVVTAQRRPDHIFTVTFTRLFERFLGAGSPLAQDLGKAVTDGFRGAAIGQSAAGLVFGRNGGGLTSGIGGAIGSIVGERAGSAFAGFAKSLGLGAGPLGGLVGGLVGGALGSLLKKAKTGFATIGGGANGNLAITSYGGNSSQFRDNAMQGGNNVIAAVERIAETFGGTVNAAVGRVSIGVRNGNIHVDPTGRGLTKKKQGAIDFGQDSEAAIRYAVLDLIKDGVLQGLRDGTKRLIEGAKDLDAALTKATQYESVFQRLREYQDPVGAALDTLNKEFDRLKRIFLEAGATTAEYAQLEQLYGIERSKAIRDAAARTTADLKGLLSELTTGNDALSFRSRLATARAAYDPLAARVAAGDREAYTEYASAARELLDIQRSFSGSQSEYFRLLDEVTALTRQRISAEENISSISASGGSPFTSSGQVINVTPDNASVVNAIQAQTQAIDAQTAAILQGFQLNAAEIVSGLAGSGQAYLKAGAF